MSGEYNGVVGYSTAPWEETDDEGFRDSVADADFAAFDALDALDGIDDEQRLPCELLWTTDDAVEVLA